MLQCLRRRRLVYAAAVQRSVYDLSFWTAKEIYEMCHIRAAAAASLWILGKQMLAVVPV